VEPSAGAGLEFFLSWAVLRLTQQVVTVRCLVLNIRCIVYDIVTDMSIWSKRDQRAGNEKKERLEELGLDSGWCVCWEGLGARA
jgi:hypothetical protein